MHTEHDTCASDHGEGEKAKETNQKAFNAEIAKEHPYKHRNCLQHQEQANPNRPNQEAEEELVVIESYAIAKEGACSKHTNTST